tara:strand:- start:1183 stop:1446 length:264 start_codon:yes stop_codon:yes gene_type:complete
LRKEKNTIKVRKKNKMKNKFFVTLLFIIFFSNLNAAEKKDCSEFKKLTKDYLACMTGNLKSSTTGLGLDTSNIKEKKTISDWFKKKK